MDRDDCGSRLDVERDHRIEQAAVVAAATNVVFDRQSTILAVEHRARKADDAAHPRERPGETDLTVHQLTSQLLAAELGQDSDAD